MRDKQHLSAIRMLPCCVCGVDASYEHRAAHHLRISPDNQPVGAGRKNGDELTLPLCSSHHNASDDSVHLSKMDELSWWKKHGVQDPIGLARELYGASGDYSAMLNCIRGSGDEQNEF